MESVNLKLYLLLILAIATGVIVDKTEGIVAGQYTGPTEIPYIASLRTNGVHFCGGSIISHYHILTAAHCLDQTTPGHFFQPGLTYVVTGTTMKHINGTMHYLRSYQSHPNYATHRGHVMKYDIAILTLVNKIAMNEHQKIIKMPMSRIPSRSTGTVSGWGDLYFRQGQGSHMLLKLKTTVMNGGECHRYDRSDPDTQSIVCALVETGRGNACQGDSGGPLVIGSTIVGIVSYGRDCTTIVPDTFTSVYFYKDWVKNSIALTGVPGVTSDTPESDFYDENKVNKVPLKYVRLVQSLPTASNIAFYTFQKGEWYAVLY